LVLTAMRVEIETFHVYTSTPLDRIARITNHLVLGGDLAGVLHLQGDVVPHRDFIDIPSKAFPVSLRFAW